MARKKKTFTEHTIIGGAADNASGIDADKAAGDTEEEHTEAAAETPVSPSAHAHLNPGSGGDYRRENGTLIRVR